MELEVTFPRLMRIWWAYFWRSIIAFIASMIIGGIVGGLLGLLLPVFGVSLDNATIYLQALGFLIGVAISVIPLELILGKNFGEFRLVLVSNADT